jgi:hypothetical protein
VIGGYTYQSGATIAQTIPAGGSLRIKALGTGTLLVRTTGGIGVVKVKSLAPAGVPVTVHGSGSNLKFEAMGVLLDAWFCSHLWYNLKLGKLPLTKGPLPPGPQPLVPLDRWLTPVAAPHRSFVVWDAFIDNPPDGFRAALLSGAEDRPMDLAVGESHGEPWLHLNVGIALGTPLDLLLDSPEQTDSEQSGALRIRRAALTMVADVEAAAPLLDVASAGEHIIGVDEFGLVHLARSDLGTVDRPVGARFQRLLEIGDLGKRATLRIIGTRAYLCTQDRLMVIDFSSDAAIIIGDCGLEGARDFAIRQGQAVVAGAEGLIAVDISDPNRPMVTQVLDAPGEGPTWFQGGSAYLAAGARLVRFGIDEHLAEAGSLELGAPIERLGGYASQVYATVGGVTQVIFLQGRADLRVVGTLSAPHWTTGLRQVREHYWKLEQASAQVHQFVPSGIDTASLDLAADMLR